MPAFFCSFVLLLANQVRGENGAPFDSWVRQSLYVPMRDGTRLALDYYRPTRGGDLHKEPLPVVWRFTPYGRYKLDEEAKVPDPVVLPTHGSGLNDSEAMRVLLSNGYILAIADWRGYSASFGVSETWLGRQQAADARDITDWLAGREWSTDRVGMMGLSALASVQYLAATDASPHLKAIFPAMGQFDHYETFYLNGIYRSDLPEAWDKVVRPPLDFSGPEALPGDVAPVTADKNRAMLLEAAQQHRKNQALDPQVKAMPFRDSPAPATGRKLHIENSMWSRLEAIQQSGVAIYHWTGWFDAYGKDQVLAYANLGNPQKLHIGPYYHADQFGGDLMGEALRWFDYWLKGIDNGIMSEPPVRYFMVGEEPEKGWREAFQWPPAGTSRRRFYLDEGLSGSVDSVNDGQLVAGTPAAAGIDRYAVDYGVSLGGYQDRNYGVFREQCRDREVVDVSCYLSSGYPDLAINYDARALTYTSAVLDQDLFLVGHSEVSLWITASSPEADLFVVLEEIDKAGRSHFVSDNALRLSHRAINNPPFNNLGLPWLGNFSTDAADLGDEPVLVRLDLNPVANKFDAGHRLRLTITGADAKSGDTAEGARGQVLNLYRGASHASWLEIPLLPARD